ncbi:isopentenyl-diphosphate Delta-isomerase I-like [Rhodamnia argentea]|uniref:Isopentenyl-diphosphate Delta-isomerase I-like n=1 Tax=Rhodamnia argentea TaxID=178133 RepID=A0ABM3GTY6_9MYRT|nr:isopentenyl-diphosphate Delta-isomerase I-like [Rhodamnia argentea]
MSDENSLIFIGKSDASVSRVPASSRLMEKIECKNWLHRAFGQFLFNSKYELLLQQRSATKATFSLVWTNTCWSHPLYQESELLGENAPGARNAAQRKLLDEVGIPAEDGPVDEFIPLGRMLCKPPSDEKWEGANFLIHGHGWHAKSPDVYVMLELITRCSSFETWRLIQAPDEAADVEDVNREQLKELLRKADAGEEGLKLSSWFRLVVDILLFMLRRGDAEVKRLI